MVECYTNFKFNDRDTFSMTEKVIAEVKELAPDNYEHVEQILSSHGFERGIPLNDKWQIYLKKVVMPTWDLIDVDSLRPIKVKNVVVEYAIKVRVSDLTMDGNEWRVISDGKWHEAEFNDQKENPFQINL